MIDFIYYIKTYQFIPLTVFLILSRLTSYPITFIASGILALICMLMAWQTRTTLDRLFAGANLFLIGGALGFILLILNIDHHLVSLYSQYTYTMFFVGILIAGIASMFTPRGFFNLPPSAKRTSSTIAFMILICAVIIIQWWLRTQGLSNYLYISTIAGFILLKILYQKLRESLK